MSTIALTPNATSALAEKFVAAGRERIDLPFRHHYKPEDTCQTGEVTNPDCMERGMDNTGLDCSGFVIVSLCDALDMRPDKWPMELRHVQQMMDLAEIGRPEPGDVVVQQINNDTHEISGFHAFILANDEAHGRTLHADGKAKKVVEGTLKKELRDYRRLQVVRLAVLVDAATL